MEKQHEKGWLRYLILFVCFIGVGITIQEPIGVEAVNVTITFNSQGGSNAGSKVVASGSKIGALPTPTKSGNYLIGWYTATTGGSAINANTIVNATLKTYTVRSGDSPVGILENNMRAGNFPNDFTRAAAIFKTINGWPQNGWPVIRIGQVVYIQDPAQANTRTYYARWGTGTTVIFDGGGGSTPTRVVIPHGGTISTIPSSLRNGYTLKGWYTTSTDGSQLTTTTKFNLPTPKKYTIKAGDSWWKMAQEQLGNGNLASQLASWNGVTIAATIHPGQVINIENPATLTTSITYYAQWHKDLKVTYVANGGNAPSFTSKTVAYNTARGAFPTINRTGHYLMGWFTKTEQGIQATVEDKIVSDQTLYAQWGILDYLVTFNSQGGTAVPAKRYVYDTTLGTLSEPTKAGNTFNGWYTLASGGTQVTSSTKVLKGITYHAQWLANRTVTFNFNGGAQANTTRVVANGKALGTLPVATRTGHNLKGWYNAASGGTAVTAATLVTSNVTYYAQWTPISYTITYNSQNGTTNRTVKLNYGSQLGTLTIPTRAGYTYKGWFTASSGGSQVLYNTKVTGNVTYYAQWLLNVKVTFDRNGGGAPSFATRDLVSGLTVGALPTITRTGYTLKGWYTAASGGTQITVNTVVTSNVTYYAQWTPLSYVVKFNANGGSAIGDKTYSYDQVLGTLPVTTRTGYTLNGWYTAASGGTKVTATTKVTGTTTYVAQWTVNKYTVTFDTNGGTTVASKEYNYAAQLGTLPTPTRTNYTLKGWFTSKTGGTRIQPETTVTGNITYYAQWETSVVPDMTVTFNSNGGTNVSSRKVKKGSPVGTLPTTTKGTDFLDGWYTALTGGVRVTEGTTVTGNVTYYARWTEGVYVTYNGNGGTVNANNQVTYQTHHKKGSAVATLPSAARTHYTLNGWFTAATGGTRVTAPVTVNQTVTYYAQWLTNKYTVTFKDGSTTVNSRQIDYNVGVGTLPTINKTGYTFNGWYTLQTGGTKVTTTTKVTGNITYYAQWLSDLVVTFNPNGGQAPSFATKYVAIGDVLGNLPTSTRVGYTFNGWFTLATGGTKVTTATKVTSNITYYAQWIADLTVVFESQGGSTVTSQKVKVNGTIINIPVPTRDRHVFRGWFTQQAGKGTQLTTTTVISKNITFYAYWTRVYQVNFDVQGGTGSTTTRSIEAGKTIGAFPTTNLTKHRFNGWFTEPGGKGEKVVTTRVPQKDETYYAHFVEQVTVTYIANWDVHSTKVMDINTAIGTLPTYVVPGYIFKGWYDDDTGKYVTAETIIEGDSTLNAVTNKIVSVEFDTLGGTPVAGLRLESGTRLPAIQTPTREGYVFRGWYTSPDGVGASYQENVAVHDDLVLYAYWTDSEYIITFETNGGTEAQPMYVVKGDSVGLSGITNKLGSRFMGWYTEPDLINQVPNLFTPTKHQRLYAKWYDVRIFELKFNVNTTGITLAPIYVTEDTAITYLPAPTRTGYGFLGWYTDSAMTKQIYEGNIPTGNLTLHAKWVKISEVINITFHPENGGSTVIRQGVKDKTIPSSYYTTPYRENSVFQGWFTQQFGVGSRVTRDTIYTQNTNVYAHWTGRDEYSEGKIPKNPELLPNLEPAPWVPREDGFIPHPSTEITETVVSEIIRTDDQILLDEAQYWLESVTSITKSDGYIKTIVFGDEGSEI